MEEWPLVLQRAVEATTNGVVITDPNQPDNPIVYANPAFERIMGQIYGVGCGRKVAQEQLAPLAHERERWRGGCYTTVIISSRFYEREWWNGRHARFRI